MGTPRRFRQDGDTGIPEIFFGCLYHVIPLQCTTKWIEATPDERTWIGWRNVSNEAQNVKLTAVKQGNCGEKAARSSGRKRKVEEKTQEKVSAC